MSVRLTVAQAQITELGGVHFARVLAEADERTFTLGLAERVGAIVDAGFSAEQAAPAAEHFATAARKARWEHVARGDDATGLDRA